MQYGVGGVGSQQRDLQVAPVNPSGQNDKAGESPSTTAGDVKAVTEGENSLNKADGHPKPEPGPNPDRVNVRGTSVQSDERGAKSIPGNDIDERLHGGLEEYLQLFFGTTELAKDEGAIRPKAAGWTQCPFHRTCTSMGTYSIPVGRATDQKEAELGLLYAILYFVLVHLVSMHSGARQLIRTVRYRISDVCVQWNNRLLLVRRMREKEKIESGKENSESKES